MPIIFFIYKGGWYLLLIPVVIILVILNLKFYFKFNEKSVEELKNQKREQILSDLGIK